MFRNSFRYPLLRPPPPPSSARPPPPAMLSPLPPGCPRRPVPHDAQFNIVVTKVLMVMITHVKSQRPGDRSWATTFYALSLIWLVSQLFFFRRRPCLFFQMSPEIVELDVFWLWWKVNGLMCFDFDLSCVHFWIVWIVWIHFDRSIKISVLWIIGLHKLYDVMVLTVLLWFPCSYIWRQFVTFFL